MTYRKNVAGIWRLAESHGNKRAFIIVLRAEWHPSLSRPCWSTYVQGQHTRQGIHRRFVRQMPGPHSCGDPCSTGWRGVLSRSQNQGVYTSVVAITESFQMTYDGGRGQTVTWEVIGLSYWSPEMSWSCQEQVVNHFRMSHKMSILGNRRDAME